MNKFSLDKIIPISFFISTSLAFAFNFSNSYQNMLIIRFLLGISFSLSIIGWYKFVESFLNNYFLYLSNLAIMILYVIGAIFSSPWISEKINSIGWRSFFSPLINIGWIFSFLIILSMHYLYKKNPQNKKNMHLNLNLKESIKLIFTKNYSIMLLYSCTVAPVFSLLIVGWGNDFFNLKFPEISSKNMPATLNMIGALIGFLFNMFFKNISTKKQMIFFSSISASSLIIMLQEKSTPTLFYLSCLLSGFAIGAHALAIYWVKKNANKSTISLSMGIQNFSFMFLGTALFQNISGYILDQKKNSSISSYQSFKSLFSYMFIPIIISALSIFFIKNNQKKPNY